MTALQPTHFWATLPRPIIGLAPMNGVTDHAFRYIQKKHGNPMLLFTEFTSVDGLCAGASALLKDFLYDESQRPIIGQIYGHIPAHFYQAAILLCELGFDGIDINMGCPAKSIAHRGAGAGLIRTPHIAQAIVRATRQGVRDWQNGATIHHCVDIPTRFAAQIEARREQLPTAYQQPRPVPISVKTRIGYDTPQVQEWIPQLLESEPVAITLHGRTLTQGYSGSSNWDEIGKAAEIAHGSGVLMLGNGDLRSLEDAWARIKIYGLDGALIGRASYGNPFIFHDAPSDTPSDAPDELSLEARYAILHIALEHARLYEASFSHMERYQFLPMRKHFGWYVRSLPGASHLRRTLMHTTTLQEAVATLEEYLAYREVWEREASRAMPRPVSAATG